MGARGGVLQTRWQGRRGGHWVVVGGRGRRSAQDPQHVAIGVYWGSHEKYNNIKSNKQRSNTNRLLGLTDGLRKAS